MDDKQILDLYWERSEAAARTRSCYIRNFKKIRKVLQIYSL